MNALPAVPSWYSGDLRTGLSGSTTWLFCVLWPLLNSSSLLRSFNRPRPFGPSFPSQAGCEGKGGCPDTCRLQAIADLSVKPPVIAVAVMPVLGIILQPVWEGVSALEDKQHARRREDAWTKRSMRIGVRLLFSQGQMSRERWLSYSHRRDVVTIIAIMAVMIRRNGYSAGLSVTGTQNMATHCVTLGR